MPDPPEQLALDLIRSTRAMVLATANPDPWSAPVYFLYTHGAFHFFSSPSSRHIEDALSTSRVAVAIFKDSDDWRDIEGLQMEGALEEIPPSERADAIVAAYVERFPTVATLLNSSDVDLALITTRLKARLYAFVPSRVFYLNNRAGLGSRREITLPR